MALQFDRQTLGKVALAIGAGVGVYMVYKAVRSRGAPDNWVQVGTISEITVYPIKSCKGRQIPEVECLTLGPKHGEYHDR